MGEGGRELGTLIFFGEFLWIYTKKHLRIFLLFYFLGSLSQKDDRIELNGEVKSQLIDASLDGIFIQTDTSFNAKGDLTYETADGQENLSLTGNYKLNNVGDMKNHTFSVQLEVYYHTYLCIMIFLRKKSK